MASPNSTGPSPYQNNGEKTYQHGGQSRFITVRLKQVIGRDEDKMNDLYFCGDFNRAKEHVVYFGGDVQDFRENMLAHRDNQRHVQWSLEDTAVILSQRFTDSNIWIVRPAAMYLKTMSVFCNFVESSGIGVPTYNENYGTLLHLRSLLTNGIKRLIEEQHVKLDGADGKNYSSEDNNKNLPIRLIGFSKGCVVLNQIIHELPLAKTDPIAEFVANFQAFYWLDGGHAGSSNTWLTDMDVLRNLIGFPVKIFVHVTPYQLNDSNRPWIAKEEKKFVTRIRELGLDITETKHFEEEQRSIEIHFKVLASF